jgi:hypothetical protein
MGSHGSIRYDNHVDSATLLAQMSTACQWVLADVQHCASPIVVMSEHLPQLRFPSFSGVLCIDFSHLIVIQLPP